MPDPASVARPWLASYPPGVPATYAWPDVPLPRLLADAARDHPDLDAVRWGGGAWTWADLDELSAGVAAGLVAHGVGPGDRVGLALDNGPAAVAVAFGTWRAGAALVLLGGDLPPVARPAVLDATTPRLTVTDDPAGWPASAGRLVVTDEQDWRPAAGRWARIRARWGARADRRGRGEHADGSDEADGAVVTDPAAPLRWDELCGDAADSPDVVSPGDAPAVLAPTGAATGRRRVVTLTHGTLVANAFQARLWVPDVQAGRERVLAAAPFTHPFGLTVGLLATTLAAGTLVVPPSMDGAALARTITEERTTLFPAVPALLEAIVEAGARTRVDLSSLRVTLVGGAPLPPDLADRFRALAGDGRVREGYGLSEASPLTHASPVYGRPHLGRGGLPVTGTTSIVVDPDDPTVVRPPGSIGLLAVTGPQVMPGYWEDPEGTAAVLRDGWLLTGDLAVMDTAGHVTVVDRVVGVVVTAAGTVFPADVEAVLRAHPAVADARVEPRPTIDGTDEVVGQVVLADDPGSGIVRDLVVHCEAQLPPHAVPAHLEVVAALPAPDDPPVATRATGSRHHPPDQEAAG